METSDRKSLSSLSSGQLNFKDLTQFQQIKQLNKQQVTNERTQSNQTNGIEMAHFGRSIIVVGSKQIACNNNKRVELDKSDKHRSSENNQVVSEGQAVTYLSTKIETSNDNNNIRKLKRRLGLASMVVLKNWLPIIQLSLLIHLPTRNLIACDDSQQQQQQHDEQLQLLNNLHQQDLQELLASASNSQLQNELIGQIQDQLSSSQSNNNNNQESLTGASGEEATSGNLVGSMQADTGPANELATNGASGDDNEQQLRQVQAEIDDLLESQSKAATSNSEANSSSAKSESSNNNNEATTAASTGSLGGQQSSGGSIISEQLTAMTNLLQQIGAQNSGLLSEAIANSVANSLIRPTLSAATSSLSSSTSSSSQSSSSASQQPVRQSSPTAKSPSTSSTQLIGGSLSLGPAPNRQNRPPTVGQIDGNIEYDSNNNAINGFIEFPNFNKSSLGAQVKPLVWAALKSVPVKLGSVGWKLLQLIAFKKVYKAHHPKSGEIIIEEEMKQPAHHTKSFKSSSMGSGGGLSDLKAAKMSLVKGALGGGGSSKMSGNSGFMGVGGGHPMMHTYGAGGGWLGSAMGGGGGGGGMMPHAMGMDVGMSPAMSASMVYQRHLLPPHPHQSHLQPNPHPHHQLHFQQQQQAHLVGQHELPLHHAHSHPATAAAAAAAATAAAIQSQWLAQSQLAADELNERESALASRIGQSASSTSSGSSSSGTSAVSVGGGGGGGSNSTTTTNGNGSLAGRHAASHAHSHQSAALQRKRSSLANGAATANWFAAPAQAYAAAAAAANAASLAASVQRQQQQHFSSSMARQQQQPAFELGPDGGFREALAGIMYQNLFDNAAAMAVQSAVKLPASGGHLQDPADAGFFNDHLADSSSMSSNSPSLTRGDSLSDWPLVDSSLSNVANRAIVSEQPIAQLPPSNNLAALTDFDDSPNSPVKRRHSIDSFKRRSSTLNAFANANVNRR